MKRAFLLKTIVAFLGVCSASEVIAQEYNATIMGPRLIVSGTGVSGNKRFTYSSSGTGGWGGAIPQVQNVPVVAAAPDFKACSSINSVSGNTWMLIMRGDCEFGAKALAAQQHGAKGVIIVNNVPSAGPVGMGAGSSGGSVTIPVLMIGNEDGLAIKSALDASVPVTISLTNWGFGYAHDITIVPSSVAPAHDGAVPVSQTGSGNPGAYKFYTGAFVANTGTQATTNIKLKQVTTFTPTGGSAVVVGTDSATAANLSVADSIIALFSANSFSHNTTQTGRYTTTYTVSSADSDMNAADNSMTTYMDVTPQVFCKGHIEGVDQNPSTSIYYSVVNNPNFLYGPMFYVNKGGYKADQVKLAVSLKDTTTKDLSGQSLAAYVFKWVDGSNGGSTDGYIQSRELSLKSIAGRTFTSLDSPGRALTLPCADSNGLAGTYVLEDNSFYWIAVDVPANWYLGCDGSANYFNRTNAAQNFATAKMDDYWAPMYVNSLQNLKDNVTDTVAQIPFVLSSNFRAHYIDSTIYGGSNGTVPAVAFFTGPFTESVAPTQAQMEQVVLFPNPATNVVNAKVNLLNNATVNYVRVVDGMGRNVYQDESRHISQGVISVPTDKLAPGNYHLLVGTNAAVLSRAFTLLAK